MKLESIILSELCHTNQTLCSFTLCRLLNNDKKRSNQTKQTDISGEQSSDYWTERIKGKESQLYGDG